MYHNKGNLQISGNFNIRKSGPIDDRLTISKLVHLSDPNLFDGFTYNGMLVTVTDDGTNNGTYRLEDKSIGKWVLDSGGSDNVEDSIGDSVTKTSSQRAIKEAIDGKVDKVDGKQLSDENFTTALLNKLATLDNNFKGYFVSSTARDQNISTPSIGNYTMQPNGEGSTSVWFYDGVVWVDTGATSLGDMLASIYDPRGISGDAFSMGNMVETLQHKVMTAIERTKLASIEEGAQKNTVTSVNGKIGDVNISRADLGLEKVNNTADLEKTVAMANRTKGTLHINGKEFNGSMDTYVNIEGGSGGTNDYNQLLNKPTFKTINNQFILGDGNIDVKQNIINNGFVLAGSFPNHDAMNESINSIQYKSTDVVVVTDYFESSLKNATVYYLAPYGNDETGDGSYENPWKTFKNTMKGSLVLLKAGEYRTSDYGIYKSYDGAYVHGIFKGIMEVTGDIRGAVENPITLPQNYKDKLVAESSAYSRYLTATVIMKESSEADVRLIVDSGNPTDYMVWMSLKSLDSDLFLMRNITLIREVVLTSTNANPSVVVAESAGIKGCVFEDCVFGFNGGNYRYLNSVSSKVMFIRCSFTNGVLISGHTPVIIEDNKINSNVDLREFVVGGTYVYSTANEEFIPLILPMQADEPYALTLKGLSELPSAKLGVEVLTAMRHPVSGKPLYTKTIDCGFLPATKTYKVVPLDIVDDYDYAKVLVDSSHIIIPDLNDFSFSVLMPWYTLESQIGVYIEADNIVIGVGSGHSNKKAYVTIEYTKTADTASSPVALVGSHKRGVPGPRGQDGTVAFGDLTEEQLEMLLNNKNIVLRTSGNLLFGNKDRTISYIDVSEKMENTIDKIILMDESGTEHRLTLNNKKDIDELDTDDYAFVDIVKLNPNPFDDYSCVASFDFNDTLNPQLGNYNLTTRTGASPLFVEDSILGKALDFGTITGGLHISNLKLDRSNTTVSFLLCLNSLVDQTIISMDGWEFRYESSAFVFQYITPSSRADKLVFSVAANTWYNITIVPGASGLGSIYVGEQKLNNSGTVSSYSGKSFPFRIGYRTYSDTLPFKGKIAGLRIFNRALNNTEAIAINNGYKSRLLAFKHDLDANIIEAKTILRTMNLYLPTFNNESEARRLGLITGDFYYRANGTMAFVL